MTEQRRLYIGGLYPEINREDIKNRFSRFGDIRSIEIKTRKDEQGSPSNTFAYIDICGSETEIKKCMSMYNNVKWKGNKMQIQQAKENFLDRLEKERQDEKDNPGRQPEKKERKKKKKDAPILIKPLDDVPGVENFQKKGAPPGPLPGQENWVVGKYGRVLPVVNLKKKGSRKILKVDPSKLTHNVKRMPDEKNEQDLSVSNLSWEMDITDNEVTKKRKGDFPEWKAPPKKKKPMPDIETFMRNDVMEAVNEDFEVVRDSKLSTSKNQSTEKGNSSITKTFTSSSKSVDLSRFDSDTESETEIDNVNDLKFGINKMNKVKTNDTSTCNKKKIDKQSSDKLPNVLAEKKKITVPNFQAKVSLNGQTKPKKAFNNNNMSFTLDEFYSGAQYSEDVSKIDDKDADSHESSDEYSDFESFVKAEEGKLKNLKGKKAGDSTNSINLNAGTVKATKIQRTYCSDSDDSNTYGDSVAKPILKQASIDNISSKPISNNAIKQKQSSHHGTTLHVSNVVKDTQKNLDKNKIEKDSNGSLGNEMKTYGTTIKMKTPTSSDSSSSEETENESDDDVSESSDESEEETTSTSKGKATSVSSLSSSSLSISPQVPEENLSDCNEASDEDIDEEESDNETDSDSSDDDSDLPQAKLADNSKVVKKEYYKKVLNKKLENNQSMKDRKDKKLDHENKEDTETSNSEENTASSESEENTVSSDSNENTESSESESDFKNLISKEMKKVKPSDKIDNTKQPAKNLGEQIGKQNVELNKTNDKLTNDIAENKSNKAIVEFHESCSSTDSDSEEECCKPANMLGIKANKSDDFKDIFTSSSPLKDKANEKSVNLKSGINSEQIDDDTDSSESESEDDTESSESESNFENLISKEMEKVKSFSNEKPPKLAVQKEDKKGKMQHNLEQDRKSIKDGSKMKFSKIKAIDNLHKSDSSESESENETYKPVNTKEMLAKHLEELKKEKELLQQKEAAEKKKAAAAEKKKTAAAEKKEAKKKTVLKRETSEKQRQEALIWRQKEHTSKQSTIKNALSSVDSAGQANKKVVFDSDGEGVPVEIKNPEKDKLEKPAKQRPDAIPKEVKKACTLFDSSSDSEEDDTEDKLRFGIRPEFEGAVGKKLMKLQSRFGNDDRFKLTANFAESDSNADSESENSEDEKTKSLKILQSVVNTDLSKLVDKKAKQKRQFKDVSMLKYDPANKDHSQFEVKPTTQEDNSENKSKKKKKKSKEPEVEPEPVPEVSKERFHEVSESVLKTFASKEDKPSTTGFSLLATFGKHDDIDVDMEVEYKTETPLPFVSHSTVTEYLTDRFKVVDEDTDKKHQKKTEGSGDKIIGKSSSQEKTETKAIIKADTTSERKPASTFFFTFDDSRLKEGEQFYRKEDMTTVREKWNQNKGDLIKSYKAQQKAVMKQRKTIGKMNGGSKRGGARRGRGGVRGGPRGGRGRSR